MAKMTDWSREREGWWMGVEMEKEEERMEGEMVGKGWENMVEMGVIRGGVMVRTNAEKSSKKWFFIQKLPPL